jgi:hypothetical protein
MIKKILFIIILVFPLTFYGCTGGKTPAIQFDRENYVFSDVTEGQEVEFTFHYSNTGKEDLLIEELSASCFCIVVKKYNSIVKPGEEGELSGIIKTEGFQGYNVKMIKLRTNIPDADPIVLTLEGNIHPLEE